MSRTVLVAIVLGCSVGAQVDADWKAARTRGLEWLAKNAASNGGWKADVGYKLNHGYQVMSAAKEHIGVTGMCVLAFVEAGYTPGEGPFQGAVDGARDLMIRSLTESGYLTREATRMKSHGWALNALARLLQLERDGLLESTVAEATSLSNRSIGNDGGWRYLPFTPDADLLSTVCQVRALLAAEAAGIRLHGDVKARVRRYLRDARIAVGKEKGWPYQARKRARISFSSTSAGLWATLALGDSVDDIDDMVARVVSLIPRDGEGDPGFTWWFGHYNAGTALALVKAEAGRKALAEWRAPVRKRILALQRADGSWKGGVGPGDPWSTAMACLILGL